MPLGITTYSIISYINPTLTMTGEGTRFHFLTHSLPSSRSSPCSYLRRVREQDDKHRRFLFWKPFVHIGNRPFPHLRTDRISAQAEFHPADSHRCESLRVYRNLRTSGVLLTRPEQAFASDRQPIVQEPPHRRRFHILPNTKHRTRVRACR